MNSRDFRERNNRTWSGKLRSGNPLNDYVAEAIERLPMSEHVIQWY
jgi:hypothetical protein